MELFEGPTRYAQFKRPDHIFDFGWEGIIHPNGVYPSIRPTDEQIFWEGTGNYLFYVDGSKA